MDAAAAKELSETSGNSFQCRVANYFRGHNWTVLLSPYFVDALSDKTRESDLIVEKSFPVRQYWVGGSRSVRLRLFVECKYAAKNAGVVFWTDAMDLTAARNWVSSRPPFNPDGRHQREHHYFQSNDPVAKLFASEKQKGDDGDPIYKALNQCINGFIHNQTRPSMISTTKLSEEVTRVDYPVIVFSSFDQFYSTDVANQVDPTPIQRNFLAEVNYAYVNPRGAAVRDYFLVDMVDFNKIESFVESLVTEMAAATCLLEQH